MSGKWLSGKQWASVQEALKAVGGDPGSNKGPGKGGQGGRGGGKGGKGGKADTPTGGGAGKGSGSVPPAGRRASSTRRKRGWTCECGTYNWDENKTCRSCSVARPAPASARPQSPPPPPAQAAAKAPAPAPAAAPKAQAPGMEVDPPQEELLRAQIKAKKSSLDFLRKSPEPTLVEDVVSKLSGEVARLEAELSTLRPPHVRLHAVAQRLQHQQDQLAEVEERITNTTKILESLRQQRGNIETALAKLKEEETAVKRELQAAAPAAPEQEAGVTELVNTKRRIDTALNIGGLPADVREHLVRAQSALLPLIPPPAPPAGPPPPCPPGAPPSGAPAPAAAAPAVSVPVPGGPDGGPGPVMGAAPAAAAVAAPSAAAADPAAAVPAAANSAAAGVPNTRVGPGRNGEVASEGDQAMTDPYGDPGSPGPGSGWQRAHSRKGKRLRPDRVRIRDGTLSPRSPGSEADAEGSGTSLE